MLMDGEAGLVEEEYGVTPLCCPQGGNSWPLLFRRLSQKSRQSLVSQAFISSLPLTCVFPGCVPSATRSPVFYLWLVARIQNFTF